ncbi:MAG: F0F1 ATP synthase subunit A [Chthoniobacteraceae bacterium]
MSIQFHDYRCPLVCRVLRQLILIVALFGFSGGMMRAADEPVHGLESADGAAHAEHKQEGLPLRALPMSEKSGFSPTSSMIVTWVVALGIIVFAQIATRKIKDVPEGAQNFWEFLVEGLYNFLESIVGKVLVKKTFWFFATVFIFILFTNWAGLIPGVGTIGWGHPNEHGALDHISRPLFRGVNADLNMTLAMSLIFFVCWIVWSLQANGIGGSILHVFGNPARREMSGLLKIAMAGIFVLVGLLEIVSILFRPVSLSFRLFGNIFAGENVLESMSHIVPALGWLIPIPFYFMELLVGIVQALVFMLLTAVFTLLMCGHANEHEKAHH